MLLLAMLGFSNASLALNESEAEDLADLTAVFIYLKNDCGYNDLPNAQIKRAIVYFAQQNRWDLSNYNSFNMKALGEDSYRDLSGIAIPTPKMQIAGARLFEPAGLRQLISPSPARLTRSLSEIQPCIAGQS